jgi:hypothetical protein
MNPIQVQQAEGNVKLTEAKTGALGKPDHAKFATMQAQLNKVENMTPGSLKEWKAYADSEGLNLTKKDVTNYGTAVRGKDGKMYRKTDVDQKRAITPKYKYELSRKPEAEDQTAESLRAAGTMEAYEAGMKLGYWK